MYIPRLQYFQAITEICISTRLMHIQLWHKAELQSRPSYQQKKKAREQYRFI